MDLKILLEYLVLGHVNCGVHDHKHKMSTSAVSLQPSTSQNQKSTQNVAYTTIPPSSLYYMPMATTSSSMWQPPAHWNVQPAPVAPVVKRKVPKTKHRTKEEREIMGQTAERFSEILFLPHTSLTGGAQVFSTVSSRP